MITLMTDRSLQYLGAASLIVRIHDNQKLTKARLTDYSDLSSAYLPQDSEQFLYDGRRVEQSGAPAIWEDYNFANDLHLRKVKEAMRKVYGFDYPKINV